MNDLIENSDQAIKTQILIRYCFIAEEMGKLHENIRKNQLNEVQERDGRIRYNLISLIEFANLNKSFRDAISPIGKKYKRGLPVTKPTHNKKIVCMAKDSIYVWENVSTALTESKLLSLGD